MEIWVQMVFVAASASEYYGEIVNNYKEALTASRTLKPIATPQYGGTLAERNKHNSMLVFKQQELLLADPLHEKRRFDEFHIELLRFSDKRNNECGGRAIPTLNLYFENISRRAISPDTCPVCNVTMHVSVDTGIYVCPTCSRYNDDPSENVNLVAQKQTRTSQQSSKHIRLEQIFASLDCSCFINASQDIKDQIQKIVKSEEHRLINLDLTTINPDDIREIFKRHKKGSLYKYVPAVYCIITSKPFLKFSAEQKRLIYIIFDEIIKVWAEEFPEEENFSHYNTVFKMLLEKIGKSDYISLLHETKNQVLRKSKKEKMDRVITTLNADPKFCDLIERVRGIPRK